jgi:protein involved in polysaccharide export with SLBB domain
VIYCFIAVSPAFAVGEKIKPGNVINITVLGYPELSKTIVVRADGTTEYPLLANIPIDGLTTSELGELLAPILMRYVDRPHLFINVMDYYMLKVKVLGEVKQPGVLLVEGPLDLQALIAQAGGPTQEADLRKVKIIRSHGGIKTEIAIDMYEVLQTEKLNINMPEIADGDLVIIPMATTESYVRVYGSVSRPGTYMPKLNDNIIDLINIAGGIRAEGNINNVTYISRKNGVVGNETYKIGKMIKDGLHDDIPKVYAGDIIIVQPKNEWHKFSWWLQLLRDALYLTSSILIIQRL